MELVKNLYISKDYFNVAFIIYDGCVAALSNHQIYHRPHARVDSFIGEEIVTVYAEEQAVITIVDEHGNCVLPFDIRCKVLQLCPYFFGKNWVMRVGNKIEVPLTATIWGYLGYGLKNNCH